MSLVMPTLLKECGFFVCVLFGGLGFLFCFWIFLGYFVLVVCFLVFCFFCISNTYNKTIQILQCGCVFSVLITKSLSPSDYLLAC